MRVSVERLNADPGQSAPADPSPSMRGWRPYLLLLAVLLLSATAVADWSPLDDPVAEVVDDPPPVAAIDLPAIDLRGRLEIDQPADPAEVPLAEGTWLEQLDAADGDLKQITAVISRAKEAGLPEDEMEAVRRAAQQAILGAYGKTKVITAAAQQLAVVMSSGADLVEKAAAIEV